MNLFVFNSIFHIYTPWKRQKSLGFVTFSRGTEMEHWAKIVFRNVDAFMKELCKG